MRKLSKVIIGMSLTTVANRVLLSSKISSKIRAVALCAIVVVSGRSIAFEDIVQASIEHANIGQTSSTQQRLSQANMANPAPGKEILSLQKAISIAQNNDEWLVKSKLLEQRLMDLSKGATALPDPTLSIGLLNLPTDGFAFDQEPMTQFKVGASQMFPRGDTLQLQEKQYQTAAAEQPFQRANRRDKVALQTTFMWLDAHSGSTSYQLVTDARPLFDKLKSIVSARYSASVGGTNQQDIIRAELELVRLQDRLFNLETSKRVAVSRLLQFLSKQSFGDGVTGYGGNSSTGGNSSYGGAIYAQKSIAEVAIPAILAPITEYEDQLISSLHGALPQSLYKMLMRHPTILAIEQRILASSIDVDIAKQAFKPQYGVNASYALRDDAPSAMGGNSRADFFSIGLNVSVPLFSNARQDAQVSGSTKMVEAMRTEKRLLLQELMAGLKSTYEQFDGASKRADIYVKQILPQMKQLSQSALNAYTNDAGDFAEVVAAEIALLDAKVTLVNINVEKRKALAYLHYYLSNANIDMQVNKQTTMPINNTSENANHE
jgi:hypothetical protein